MSARSVVFGALAWLVAYVQAEHLRTKFVLNFRNDVPLVELERFCERAERQDDDSNHVHGICEGKGWKQAQKGDRPATEMHPGIQRFERFKMVLFEAQSELDLKLLKEDKELASMIHTIEEDKEYRVDARHLERELQSFAPVEMLLDEPEVDDGAFENKGYTGEGVHVFIVDTGLRTTHEEFEGRVGLSYNAFIEDKLENSDDNGHGSHVAGICCGTTRGLAPNVTIHPVKVMDSMGNGFLSGILDGLEWVEDQLLENPDWPALVIMSISGGKSPALNEAIDSLVRNTGVLVVTSAGNYPRGERPENACDVSPASAELVLTAGSMSDNLTLSPFSNIGPCVDIFAPGEDIESAWYTSDDSTYVLSGTSMATPLVAAAAALYLQSFPEATYEEVAEAIMTEATVQTVVDPMSEFTGSPSEVLDVGRLLRWLPPLEDTVLQAPAPEPFMEEEAPAPEPSTEEETPAPEPSTEEEIPAPEPTTEVGMPEPEAIPPELVLLPPPPPPPQSPPTSEEREPVPCEVGEWLAWSGDCYDEDGNCRIGQFQFRARQIVQLPGPGASCPHIQEGRVCQCTVEARRDEARAFRFRDLWMFARGV